MSKKVKVKKSKTVAEVEKSYRRDMARAVAECLRAAGIEKVTAEPLGPSESGKLWYVNAPESVSDETIAELKAAIEKERKLVDYRGVFSTFQRALAIASAAAAKGCKDIVPRPTADIGRYTLTVDLFPKGLDVDLFDIIERVASEQREMRLAEQHKGPATFSVHIGDHFGKLIARLIAEGRYANRSEVIREGLRLVELQNDERMEAMDKSNAKFGKRAS